MLKRIHSETKGDTKIIILWNDENQTHLLRQYNCNLLVKEKEISSLWDCHAELIEILGLDAY